LHNRRFEISDADERRGGESERLANIFVFELRVLALELGPVGISRQGFEHMADRQSQVANSRPIIHVGRVGGDTVEARHGLDLAPQPTVLVDPIMALASSWEKSDWMQAV
jgi:hypothetical protein